MLHSVSEGSSYRICDGDVSMCCLSVRRTTIDENCFLLPLFCCSFVRLFDVLRTRSSQITGSSPESSLATRFIQLAGLQHIGTLTRQQQR